MALIDDEKVQAAFNYLHDSAEAAAIAKMRKVRTDFYRKHLKAKLIKESKGTSAAERTTDAEANPKYWEACEEHALAVRDDAWHYSKKGDAEAIIEAWRTEQANLRGAMKVG